ncbi:glycosyltransferase family 2 protein [uncultured Robinsoniella sp.]|uniref:glycosyltransferase family 2 protein n=1 Tax=uncultured Robinsoniella sp. TaxID=904190 RepID=UPI00374FAFDC
MCKVSIVIPNFNGMAYLDNCLDSLRRQTEKDFEILLVDNGSEDGSISFVKEKYPEVKCIVLKRNYGFCRAVNTGIMKAKAPYVILLNNDTKAEEEFVEAMIADMEMHPGCFSSQAKLLQLHNPTLMDDGGNYYCALGWAFAWGKDMPAILYDEPRRIFAACAAAAIYRKSVFQEIGYFDEMHYAYLEDIDIGYRARIAGYENRYAPGAVVHHVGSGTTGSRYNEFKIGYSARNNIYLVYKNMPFLQILLNIPFLIAGILVKTVFFGSKGYLKEYMQGIWKGFALSAKGSKVKFKKKNIKNYVKIQFELWINIIKRLKNTR